MMEGILILFGAQLANCSFPKLNLEECSALHYAFFAR
jgi:hypothetical protein